MKTLEDRLKEEITILGNKFASLEHIKERTDQGLVAVENGDYENVINLYGELSQQEAQHIARQPGWQIEKAIREQTPNEIKKTKKELSEKVEAHYNEVVEGLEKYLPNAIAEIPKLEAEGSQYDEINAARKDYESWKEKAKKGDIKSYADKVGNSVLKSLLAIATPDELKSLLDGRVKIAQAQYLSHFADEEGKFDLAKMREYLAHAKKDETLYSETGKLYSQEIIDKMNKKAA